MSVFKSHKSKFILGLAASFMLVAIIPSCGGKYKDYSFIYWSDMNALNDLKDYVKRVTDEKNEKFIPVADRLATFDINGTIYGERAMRYAEYMMFPWYYNKPTTDKKDSSKEYEFNNENDASKETTKTVKITFGQFVKRIGEYTTNRSDDGRVYPSDTHETNTPFTTIDKAAPQFAAYLFENFTEKQYYDCTNEFMQTKVGCFTNVNYCDMFYKPMLEVLNFLKQNEFTIYIVSNSDRMFVRELMKQTDKIDIPNNHIIGLDVKLKFSESDHLIHRTSSLLSRDKAEDIAQEIGKQPVLSFGNTKSDKSMHDYCLKNNKYESQAYMVLADDRERDFGDDDSKLQAFMEDCRRSGYKMFSTKNHWKTIYGDNVEKQ